VSIDDALKSAPRTLNAVIESLYALRGVARLTVIGSFTRFGSAKQLMAYCGVETSTSMWSDTLGDRCRQALCQRNRRRSID
jgi:hypothetical protein